MRSRQEEQTRPGRRLRRTVAVAAVSLVTVLTALATPGSANSPRGAATAPQGSDGATTRPACPRDTGEALCLLSVVTDDDGTSVGPNTVGGGLTAAELQDAYNLRSDWLGGGQTIAVVVPYDNTSAAFDLAAYREGSGLSECGAERGCFRKVNQRGGETLPPANPNWQAHGAVGLQMASAACPNCDLLLVEADDETPQSMAAAVDQAVDQGADAVTVMWAYYEFEGQSAYAKSFDHPGVAITAQAGQGFNTDGRQLMPSAYNSVVAVGATELFADPGSARGWAERAWSSTGSGCSLYEKKASWQRKDACGDRRTVADVAAVGAYSTPVRIYSSNLGGWSNVVGTPVSSSFVAGVYGLAGTDTTTPAAQRPYKNAQYLFDITAGANGACGGDKLCTATRGYDGPSGMGTPNGTGAF
ncbi:hypothetical protein AQ490_21925 [Wenjunlia vitaminophila]|uniref:Uncharacterized protein n=1 Tax=Wenjunlia vitaminophila TaxID=76728 RepID=A0A0T6LSG3_WENVI|nr:hypothetical protein [Wenjunlia vitaminophila]KRV48981.1 hypothetical protein AQ490_21925 [Wenjunlia vitaminophila]